MKILKILIKIIYLPFKLISLLVIIPIAVQSNDTFEELLEDIGDFLW